MTLYCGEQTAVLGLYGYCYCCYILVSVLKTFIHDPLVEWGKVKGRPTSAEATNEKVHMYMFTIVVYIHTMYKEGISMTIVCTCLHVDYC